MENGDSQKFYGMYRGVVMKNKDPEGHRRIQVKIHLVETPLLKIGLGLGLPSTLVNAPTFQKLARVYGFNLSQVTLPTQFGQVLLART